MSSVGASARALAPFIFGFVFALSTAAGHLDFPLDVSLAFFLTVFSLATAMIFVASAPRGDAAGDEAARFASRTRPWSRWRRWRASAPQRDSGAELAGTGTARARA